MEWDVPRFRTQEDFMSALAAAAAIVLCVPQDEARLKEAWPKLAEAWKAVEAYRPAPEAGMLDDEVLKIAAKLHSAFEAAGLFATEGEYLPQAVKALVKIKARAILPAGQGLWSARAGLVRALRVRAAGGGFEAVSGVDADPLGALLASLKKLETMKAAGLDDEDNVQDELVTARKALKSLGITADDTPSGLRRRALHIVKALALGEEYPAPPAATEEQAAKYRAWAADLGNEAIETREAATKELMKAGETALPIIRDALKSPDGEVSARARLLLGYNHAPWTKIKSPEAGFWGEIPMVAPPAPPPPLGEEPK
jgi:hypothetical protein